jgi:hypothetical protein
MGFAWNMGPSCRLSFARAAASGSRKCRSRAARYPGRLKWPVLRHSRRKDVKREIAKVAWGLLSVWLGAYSFELWPIGVSGGELYWHGIPHILTWLGVSVLGIVLIDKVGAKPD